MAPAVLTERKPEEVNEKHNFGSLQLRHAESNQIILIPTPTNDPNGEYNSSRILLSHIMKINTHTQGRPT